MSKDMTIYERYRFGEKRLAVGERDAAQVENAGTREVLGFPVLEALPSARVPYEHVDPWTGHHCVAVSASVPLTVRVYAGVGHPRRVMCSTDVVRSSSTSGMGTTPRPGPVGTFRQPSSSRNGGVMSSS
jgi:hypothetical protein